MSAVRTVMAKKKQQPSNKSAGQPEKKADIKAYIKENKVSIIVLAIAALIFIGALLWIHSEEILHGEEEMFDPYGKEELVEFEKAKVLEIVSDDKRIDEVADNAYVGTQQLSVTVKSGRYKGETMTAYNYFGPLYGVPVEVGDGVVLTIKTHIDGTYSATVYEFNRIPMLIVFLLLFFAVTALIGGRTGVQSLLGLCFSVVCLFFILIPLLLKGAPTIFTTFIVCCYVAVVCFTILGGIHRKTVSAFLGTMAGAFIALVFGGCVQYFAKIDGLRLEDTEPLLQLKYAGDNIPIHLKGLLVAGIIVSALGAVMDVAMSISSSLEEIHAANPSMSQKELFKSGMNIGRDMVGTMTNTLILAFLGSEFTLIIFLYIRGLTFYHLFSTVFVSVETISGLSASIGMILAIPLTAFISSTLIKSVKKKKR